MMVCPLFRLAAILLLVPCVANAADNWPAFRGPHGDGHADATGLPITFGETENVRWRTPIAGKAWSSPVVWGEQVWVTNATVDGKELSALCLNRNTGKIEKEIAVFHVEKPAFCHAFNSYASSTPVIEEGRLYAHYGSHGTACVDTNTGKILWTRQDFSCDHFRAAGSSPVLFQNLLIIPFDGVDVQYVVALDKLTGKTVWQRDRDIEFANNNPDFKKAYSTPSIVDVNGKSQLVIPAAMVTQSFDPLTGRPLWFVKHGGMNAAAKPVYGLGKVFVSTGNGGLQLVAVRPDGQGDVTKSHLEWSSPSNVPCRCSFLLLGERILMVNEKGMASLVDAKTGKSLSQARLNKSFSSSPIYADGRIYMCSEDGPVSVLSVGDEIKELASNKLESGSMASPAAVGKSLLVRTKTHLYCFEKQ